ncbi:hypothetical protein [Luteolibacter sp. LG18]|uniref:hypothetical protein n=1 Tax=Luteolibacter sp. LG18 TaxID=2819286 RepID=UPI0030C6D359
MLPAPVGGVKRRVTAILLCLLLLVSAFAAWAWLRPYDWHADPAARFKIVQAQLKRDHSYYWLDLMLERGGEARHDDTKPVTLKTASGRVLEPADTTLAGNEGEAPDQRLWLKFWLEPADLNGPLELKLNDGTLSVKSGGGVPAVGADGPKLFLSNHW